MDKEKNLWEKQHKTRKREKWNEINENKSNREEIYKKT